MIIVQARLVTSIVKQMIEGKNIKELKKLMNSVIIMFNKSLNK